MTGNHLSVVPVFLCAAVFNFVLFASSAPYQSIGCFRDRGSRAIATLERQDHILDGLYWTRHNPIQKCYQAAKKRGFRVFAVQNGGWCASSAIAKQRYQIYGTSAACRADGEGGPWANQVYVIKAVVPPFESIGCFQDHGNRAIAPLEGQDYILDGPYPTRYNPIQKCYEAAMKRGFRVFAVQNGGWCASSAIAQQTFQKYGRSGACRADGEGGPWANQVYVIKAVVPPFESIGCFQDHGNRAIAPLEGQDHILDAPYWTRHNPIQKCYEAAKKRGFRVFAVQNGGWCASSASAGSTYNNYGTSTACRSDGEGGPWANQVYLIKS